jgi:hypothetical protein
MYQIAEDLSPLAKFVARLSQRDHKSYYLVSDAAAMVGRSADTLTRWRRSGKVAAPSAIARFGRYKIHLYTDDDIAELQEYFHLSNSTAPGLPINPQQLSTIPVPLVQAS